MHKLQILIGSLTIFWLSTTANAFTFKTWHLANSATVVFYQTSELPMLDIELAFAAGSAYDGRKFGLSALTTNLLHQGSGSLNTTQIAEILANTGAQFNTDNNRDMAVLHLRTLTDPLAMTSAINTLALIINKPMFNYQAFIREKEQLLAAIAQRETSPADIANVALFQSLYNDHPYAHPILGTKATVTNINHWEVRSFYKKYFVGANATLVLVGAIETKEAHHLARLLVGGLPKGGQVSIPKVHAAPKLASTTKIAFPSTQTMLRLGQLGINHQDPNYFALLVGNYILGGENMISRLATEVREQRGLTYDINSQLLPMPGVGPFIIGLSTKTNQLRTALATTKQILLEFLKSGPSEKELVAAKQYLIGSFPLSFANNLNIANALLKISFYKLPHEYLNTYIANIENVTQSDIQRSFTALINPETMSQITVGKV